MDRYRLTHSGINAGRAIRMIKMKIRERDDHKCVKCGTRRQPGQPQLDVHRKDGRGEYTLENCVTMCKPCHQQEPKHKDGDPTPERNQISQRLELKAGPIRMFKHPKFAAAS